MAAKRNPYTFINPEILRKIDERTSAICSAHAVPADNRFQVWQMVATIMLGKATEVRFDGDGITNDYWSRGSTNPLTAFQGFYRMDRGQWYGWSAYTVWNVISTGACGTTTDPATQTDHCRSTYGIYDLVWEDAPMQDGWYWFVHAPTYAAALTTAALHAAQPGYRAHAIVPSRWEDGYRVTVWSARKCPNADNMPTRVPAAALVPVPVRLQPGASRASRGSLQARARAAIMAA